MYILWRWSAGHSFSSDYCKWLLVYHRKINNAHSLLLLRQTIYKEMTVKSLSQMFDIKYIIAHNDK